MSGGSRMARHFGRILRAGSFAAAIVTLVASSGGQALASEAFDAINAGFLNGMQDVPAGNNIVDVPGPHFPFQTGEKSPSLLSLPTSTSLLLLQSPRLHIMEVHLPL